MPGVGLRVVHAVLGRVRGTQRGPGAGRQPVDAVERRLLIEALETVLRDDRSAVYVSTPITTGRRFVRWRATAGLKPGDPGYAEGLRAVVADNIAHARPVIDAVAAELPGHVIDPTRLGAVAGWSQFDFHGFWVEVIERFAATVVFLDGWHYSSGCVLEFAAAARLGRQLLTEDRAPLSVEDGRAMVAGAMDEMAGLGLDTAVLRQALGQLSDLRAPGRTLRG